MKTSSNLKHKKTVEKYTGDLKSLAEDIGNLHYESLKEFLAHLSNKLHSDAKKDLKRGRNKLSDELSGASEYIKISSSFIEKAWQISKPYMKEKQ